MEIQNIEHMGYWYKKHVLWHWATNLQDTVYLHQKIFATFSSRLLGSSSAFLAFLIVVWHLEVLLAIIIIKKPYKMHANS